MLLRGLDAGTYLSTNDHDKKVQMQCYRLNVCTPQSQLLEILNASPTALFTHKVRQHG